MKIYNLGITILLSLALTACGGEYYEGTYTDASAGTKYKNKVTSIVIDGDTISMTGKKGNEEKVKALKTSDFKTVESNGVKTLSFKASVIDSEGVASERKRDLNMLVFNDDRVINIQGDYFIRDGVDLSDFSEDFIGEYNMVVNGKTRTLKITDNQLIFGEEKTINYIALLPVPKGDKRLLLVISDEVRPSRVQLTVDAENNLSIQGKKLNRI